MDYTTIFNAVLALLGAIITAFVVPYVKSKTTEAQQATIGTWIGIAVAAAEQMFDSQMGEEKLEYVQNYLETLGISVTVEEIESSVYWLHSAVEVSADA